jgi:hypothetical protein
MTGSQDFEAPGNLFARHAYTSIAAAQKLVNDVGDSAPERIALYWKQAAESYHLACTSDREETRAGYLGVAMAWAAMARELERDQGVRAEELAEVRTSH